MITKFISILIIKHLQKRYRYISIRNRYNQTNQVLAKLKLIQSILYFFKNQFSAWGYFHSDCIWSEDDENYFKKLFPQKDFEELDQVVWCNPSAITYYHNKIYKLSKQCPPIYTEEIKKTTYKMGKMELIA